MEIPAVVVLQWHTGSGSNTHLAVLETAALPIELPACVKGRRGRALPALEGIEPIATNQTFLSVSLSTDHSLAASRGGCSRI